MTSVLASEIAEQPEELAAFLARHRDRASKVVAQLPPFTHIVLAARGTSDHAGTYARYLWPHLGGFPVAPATPSLHTLYRTPPRFDGALVVGISQSGQSPDIVAVLEEARRQGRPTLALTNDLRSPLATVAHDAFDLCQSPERSIAAVKTYTTELLGVALLGALWSRDKGRLDALAAIPAAAAEVLAQAEEPAARAAERLSGAQLVLTLARGFNLCTAEEMALKLRELLGLATTPFSAADFRHGSIAFVRPGVPVALVMPKGAAWDDMRLLVGEVAARGGMVITISDAPDVAPPDGIALPIATSLPEWLSPITAILPGQRLALAMALARGLDPDRPRGLPEKIIRTV